MKRQKVKQERRDTHKAHQAAKRAQQVLDRREGKKLSASALLQTSPESKLQSASADSGLQEAYEDIPANGHCDLAPLNKDEGLTRKVMYTASVRTRRNMSTVIRSVQSEYKPIGKEIGKMSEHVPQDGTTERDSGGKPTVAAQTNTAGKPVSEQARDAEFQGKELWSQNRLSEIIRKIELARRLEVRIHKHPTVPNPLYAAQAAHSNANEKHTNSKKVMLSRTKKSGTRMSDVVGFDSLQGALGRKGAKLRPAIERADATQLELLREY